MCRPVPPSIPEQIAANKAPYYDALEQADRAWRGDKVDVVTIENLLGGMLA